MDPCQSQGENLSSWNMMGVSPTINNISDPLMVDTGAFLLEGPLVLIVKYDRIVLQ
jgi:hypothetical protein